MSCPSDANTGFIKIDGSIPPEYLNSITINSYPLSISFKSRTTIPSLVRNRIDETTENTCTYLGHKFTLVDVQICDIVSKGYTTKKPVAELVLSFSSNSTVKTLSGILLCVPIYDNGTPNHNNYLDRIIDSDNKDYINTDNKPTVPNLETIFYESKSDTTQSSFAYTTCFETYNEKSKNLSSKSLYIIVFPNGITLRANMYQKLRTKLNITESYPSYSVPASISGGDPTLKDYRFVDGKKIATIISTDGNIYSTTISGCDGNFKHIFEYFTLPPSIPSNKWNSEQCPYYKTNQYKCVPFNQSKDLSGNLVVPGNKTLETIIKDREKTQSNAITIDTSSKSLTTEEIEGIVAGVAGIVIVAIICLKLGDWISKEA